MASRRDELNAYTFAKKRTIAAFLQPSPVSTDEGAPRPLRAVLPSLVVGALVAAGFGAFGMFKPQAPAGWSKAKAHVIVGSDSTTRYVVLKTNGKNQLHPVLNFASAKLLLDPDKAEVIKVSEKELDSGKVPRGSTLGIPYAPDRVPDPEEAGKKKLWAVCEQPGGGGKIVQKGVFLFADRETKRIENEHRLSGAQALYVEGPDGARYLVDPGGTAHPIGSTKGEKRSAQDLVLLRSLFEEGAQPQRVTGDWLGTLHKGTPITFPRLPAPIGGKAGVDTLPDRLDKVGTVLKANAGSKMHSYVVLPGKVAAVSELVARLLLNSPDAGTLRQNGSAEQVGTQAIGPGLDTFYGGSGWPQSVPSQANAASSKASSAPSSSSPAAASADTVCSVLHGLGAKNTPRLTTWAGPDYPAQMVDGATSAYVTPGTGMLYRDFHGVSTKTGSLFLVTDTGLRYAVQTNGDSSAKKSGIGSNGKRQKPGEQAQNLNDAQIRLGYKDIDPVPVPDNWSAFLPKGPKLDVSSALQSQSS
ncbi:type VII secretion protein EccB [Streptomyces sp. H27-D2]|uniref:type VII secretion protein EccB n=1 Tax=Streptomyces sp. H27-D2 TaxID=3046304 RepID=UPI002DB62122|nr:type VII secretion protein EccB [Streptomyces sp. H27-D2]MEC4019166.1 type VII secretion protein EccB [Streptomyces sp. H27-D2]